MSIFKKTFIIIFSMIAIFSFSAYGVVNANTIDEVCSGIGGTVGTSGCDPTASQGGQSLPELAALIINILSWVVGAVAVIMLIFAGFRYVTSGGDENGIKGAKNTILYAIIGLVIVALAQIIVNFVLNRANTLTT